MFNDGKTGATERNQHGRTTRNDDKSHGALREKPRIPFGRARSHDSLRKGLAEIPCHVANEAMNRGLGDAIANERIHGLSHDAQWWFVKA